MNVINLLYIPLIFFPIHTCVLVLGYGNIQIFYDLLFPLSLTNETDTTLNSIILNIFKTWSSNCIAFYLLNQFSIVYYIVSSCDHYK